MKYTLKKPIQVGEGPAVTELTFREEVVAGDMRGIAMRDPMMFDDIMKIAGRLCGQPDPVMSKMSFADMTEVILMVSGFIGAGPLTGIVPALS